MKWVFCFAVIKSTAVVYHSFFVAVCYGLIFYFYFHEFTLYVLINFLIHCVKMQNMVYSNSSSQPWNFKPETVDLGSSKRLHISNILFSMYKMYRIKSTPITIWINCPFVTYLVQKFTLRYNRYCLCFHTTDRFILTIHEYKINIFNDWFTF